MGDENHASHDHGHASEDDTEDADVIDDAVAEETIAEITGTR